MKKNLVLSIAFVAILAMGSASALTIEVSTVKFTTSSTLPFGQLGGGCGGGGCHGGGHCHNNTNLTEITGVLILDGTTFSIDSTVLMFGCYNYLNTTISPYDFDGDGVTETIWNELLGMVGTSINVEGFMCCQNTRLVVYYINGIEYRDGCPGNFTKVCIH
jgi:hypothetical protein